MKRVLVIFLPLILALVGWSAVCADDGFYVVPAMRGQYAPVPKTGQTDSYGVIGTDGDLEKGVAWPTPRFNDNNNGTVTDKLTELIWMKNGNAFGLRTWLQALSNANALYSGSISGLTDGSKTGDWRLPNIQELQSLVDYSRNAVPAIPAGTPFINVQSGYWSSTTYANYPPYAWMVNFIGGFVDNDDKTTVNYVWCVRDGK
jgi:hypothetical protein